MRIKLKNITLKVPDDPKQINAYQYAQIRICAAKMSSLCQDLNNLRSKIADIISAIHVDSKEKALQELELLYYSAHLSVSNLDAMQDAFVWITSRPEKALLLSERDVKELFKIYCLQGLTQQQVEDAVLFFFEQIGTKLKKRFPNFFTHRDEAILNHQKAAIYWTLQSVIHPDDTSIVEMIKQAVVDILEQKQYFDWNESSIDYYVTKAWKEYDGLCFLIEKETKINANELSLYKFLSVLENLETQ